MAQVDVFTPDELIAGNAHTATVGTVTIKAGEGELKRGSVLMRNSDDKFVLAADEAGTAEVILSADVDASGESDVVAEAYITGDFNVNALITADGYTLAEADKVSLKNAGIYIEVGVEAVSAETLGI